MRGKIHEAAKLRELAQDCDRAIKAGDLATAQKLLTRVHVVRMESSLRAEFARLYIRVGQPLVAARVLAPRIQVEGKSPQTPASPLEQAIYAHSMTKIGSYIEGISRLERIQPRVPEADLYLAFAYQNSWAYEKALAPLEAYIARADVPTYQKLVAKLNKVACLAALNLDAEALNLIADLKSEMASQNLKLLEKNLAELRLQIAVQKQDWQEFDRIHAEHIESAGGTSGVYDLFFDKWGAIGNLMKDPTLENIANVAQLKVRAQKLGHWETVRECDRALVVCSRNQDLFAFLYMGTPYPTYRAKLKSQCAEWAKVPEFLEFGKTLKKILDVQTGQIVESQTQIVKPNQLHSRSLQALAADLYRPCHIGAMHQHLFPGDYFNPFSSPKRVQTALARTKKHLLEHRLVLAVDIKDNFFKLNLADCNFGFRLRIEFKE